MLITSLSIENYRSITKAILPLQNYSILIGPNNQGKSNILRGLAVSLYTIEEALMDSRIFYQQKTLQKRNFLRHQRRRRSNDSLHYQYRRDYPLKLQHTDLEKKGTTKFYLVFSLDLKEKAKFEKETGNKIKGDLNFLLETGFNSQKIGFEDSLFPKKRIKNFTKIFAFLVDNVAVTYIEAIRDSDKTLDIVEEMISDELSRLESRKKYNNLMKKVEKMQQEILDPLSKGLTKSVSEFLPDVKKIHLDSKERLRRISRLATTLYVDDGNDTSLELKGDGIKSLVAISIIQHATQQNASKQKIILAIEEPESHLHPEAIHKLRAILEDISTKNQVIISSHSPLLVNRTDLSRNLIVDQSRAIAAKSISDIRKVLGVQIADNLSSASLVILTEGIDDSEKLKKWTCDLSSKVEKAISDGTIVFDDLSGSHNLAYKSSLWKNLLCDVRAFLDNDRDGQKAFDTANQKASMSIENVTFANLNGYSESELEDLILPSVYQHEIKKMGVDISNSKEFKKKKKKWSIRMKNTFKDQGKTWNDQIEHSVKEILTRISKEKGIKCIHPQNQKPIKKFVADLEDYLDSRQETQKHLQLLLSKTKP